MKIRDLFETPKKAVITSACAAGILLVLGTGTVFAASAIAEGSSIGAENAQNFAFADAGVDPLSAKNVRTEFDFEQGQFIYDVDFIANGTEYDYWIKASDGSVVKKELEIIEPGAVAAVSEITEEEAKKLALSDAGLKEEDVTFTRIGQDMENGVSVYDFEFYSGNTEYEYEINATVGTIYSKSKNTVITQEAPQSEPEPEEQPSEDTPVQSQEVPAQPKEEPVPPKEESVQPVQTPQTNSSAVQAEAPKAGQASGQISLDDAKAAALSDAGVSSVTYTKAEQDREDGILVYEIEFYTSTHEYDYEIDAATGAVRKRDVEAFHSHSSGQTGGSSIGLDKAKSIAVGHAGFSASDVVFSKAKMDEDDGLTVFEIEFYKDGVEYEYKIDAGSGSILEYDTDY